jgi:hypothetical protein
MIRVDIQVRKREEGEDHCVHTNYSFFFFFFFLAITVAIKKFNLRKTEQARNLYLLLRGWFDT